MNINQIRMLAKAERLMDSGEIPWVWALSLNGSYERVSVAPDIMETLGLEQGQTINAFILNAIAELSLQILRERIEDMAQEIQDSLLTEDFDFRKEMDN